MRYNKKPVWLGNVLLGIFPNTGYRPMTQETGIKMPQFRLAYLAVFLLIFAPQVLSVRVAAQTNSGIVFGIEQTSSYHRVRRIGFTDVTQHTSTVLVNRIGDLSYKPSPDNRWLAYGNFLAEGQIQCEIRDLEAGANLIYAGEIATQCIPLWGGDSQHVVFATQSGMRWDLKIFDLNARHLADTQLSFEGAYFGSWEASRSPNGQTMLFRIPAEENLYKLIMMDLRTGEIMPLDIPPASNWDFFWSPNGDRVQLTAKYPMNDTGSWIYRVFLYDIQNQENLDLYNNNMVFHLRWSPNGSGFAFVQNFDRIGIVNERNQIQSVIPPENDTKLSELIWLADNRTLLVNTFSIQGVKLWRLDTETLDWSQIYLPKHKNLRWWFSPNRSLLSISYRNGENWYYAVYDLTTDHFIPVNFFTSRYYEGYWSANSEQICWRVDSEVRNQGNQVTKRHFYQYTYNINDHKLSKVEIETAYGPPTPCGSILDDSEMLTQMIKSSTFVGLPFAHYTDFFAPLRVH